jgi:hypothetical protein
MYTNVPKIGVINIIKKILENNNEIENNTHIRNNNRTKLLPV